MGVLSPHDPGLGVLSPHDPGLGVLSPHDPWLGVLSPHDPGLGVLSPHDPGLGVLSPLSPHDPSRPVTKLRIGTASAGDTHSLACRTNPPTASIMPQYGVA